MGIGARVSRRTGPRTGRNSFPALRLCSYGAVVKVVHVQAGSSGYRALVGAGILDRIGAEVAAVVRGPRCAVIGDANSARFFGEQIVRSLRAANFEPTLITVPAGEASKSLERTGAVCDEMTAAGLDRSSFVVALGGGVIGDLAGFAAAIYHRGIPHVQVPTTLLAQVDSSIGGKTAVNTAAGKNLLGAVHQPALVVADVETLRTLPRREFQQGFAEIIKHAVIADASLFDLLHQADDGEISPDHRTELVRRNIQIKADVVARDEHDVSGARAILNFGHTVAHGIERAAEYGTVLHGEAVSLGMLVACELSVRKAGLAESERRKLTAALEKVGLPTKLPPEFPRDRILPALQRDKKFEGGQVRFVVTPRLGAAHLTSDITLDDIAAAIDLL